ncbi:hypothetical protein K439DRAFT_217768 [Ramaria rubella]|nr:hypothetical protein K439DRAFT_217768 [Ramaria rubella]
MSCEQSPTAEEHEQRSPSPAISLLSTPSRVIGAVANSHGNSAYSPSTVPVAKIDEVAALRLEIFKPCRDRIRAAQMMLTWTREGEQVWMWPCHPDGCAFADYELPTAFEKYHIEIPQCPCAIQETDCTIRHNYHIWVMQQGQYRGKVAAACVLRGQGCAAWICLTDLLANNPDLPSQVYQQRSSNNLSPGTFISFVSLISLMLSMLESYIGLPGFNSLGLLRYNRNHNNNANISSGIQPITPPPPYTSKGKGFGSGSVANKSPSKGKASTFKKSVRSHAAGMVDPFIVPGPRPSHVSSTGTSRTSPSTSTFTLPPLPLPSDTGSRATPKDANTAPSIPQSSEPPSSTMPPSNQLSLNTQQPSTPSDDTTPRSKQNVYESVTIMPGDRPFGETACLWDPPDAKHIFTYNRHVPALQGVSMSDAIHMLSSDVGTTSKTFWHAFDQCNCGHFFTKEALHYNHGPVCPMWPYRDIPPRFSEHPSFQ